jgi:hypothetical protein
VYVLLCRIYSYSGCRRLKQSSEATYKVSRDMQRGQHLREAHASEVHTSGVHTPLMDTTSKTPDHNHDPAPNSHLRCGAHLLLSPLSKLWNPSPASPGRSLLRRKESSPDTITPIRLQEGCYPLQVSPCTPAHNKAGGLYGKSPKKHG